MSAHIKKFDLSDNIGFDYSELIEDLPSKLDKIVVDNIKNAVARGVHWIEFGVSKSGVNLIAGVDFYEAVGEFIEIGTTLDEMVDWFIEANVSRRFSPDEIVWVDSWDRTSYEMLRDALRANADKIDELLKKKAPTSVDNT